MGFLPVSMALTLLTTLVTLTIVRVDIYSDRQLILILLNMSYSGLLLTSHDDGQKV